MELICDYMKDGDLRRKLNHLTRKTFGFDFEGWVLCKIHNLRLQN